MGMLNKCNKKKERYICYVWYLKSKVRQMKIKKDPDIYGIVFGKCDQSL